MDSRDFFVSFIDGSNKCILEDKHLIIVQQNNTKHPYNGGGLAGGIYEQFKEMQYLSKKTRRIDDEETRMKLYGTCEIIPVCTDKPENERRYVVNLFAQYSPGSFRIGEDSKENRAIKFGLALEDFAEKLDLESNRNIRTIARTDGIAFPTNIGCATAGGDWEQYQHIILEFAYKYKYPVKIVSRRHSNIEGIPKKLEHDEKMYEKYLYS